MKPQHMRRIFPLFAAVLLLCGFFGLEPEYKFIPVQGSTVGTKQPGVLHTDQSPGFNNVTYNRAEVTSGDYRLVFTSQLTKKNPSYPKPTPDRHKLEVVFVPAAAPPVGENTAALPGQAVVPDAAAPLYVNKLPYAVIAEGSRVYLAYADDGQIFMKTGTFKPGASPGIDFSPPQKLFACRYCAERFYLAATPSRLHLLWAESNGTGSYGVLHYASIAKDDFAQGKMDWQQQVISKTAMVWAHTLVTDKEQVYIIWPDYRFRKTDLFAGDKNKGKIFIIRSLDEGKKFLRPAGVVNNPDDPADIADTLSASIDDKALIIFWKQEIGYYTPGYYGAIVTRDLSAQKRP